MPNTELQQTLLLKDLDQRFQEKVFHMQRYHRQSDLLQLYLTLVVGVVTFLLTSGFQNAVTGIAWPHGINREHVIFAVILLAWLFAEHLLFALIDSFVLVFRNAHRIATVEEELNRLAGSALLAWDSRISPQFYLHWRILETPFRFDTLAPATLFAIFLSVVAALYGACLILTPSLIMCATWIFGFAIAANLIQLLYVSTRLLKDIKRRTERYGQQSELIKP